MGGRGNRPVGRGVALATAVGLLIALIVSGCGGREELTGAVPAGEIADGQALYEANCAACHGLQGEGQPNWQQANAEGIFPAPPHDGSGHTWHHPDPLLLRIIAEGGQTPGSTMPGYAETMTRAEMEAVLAYIKTFWSPEQQAAQADITQRSPE